MYELRDMGGAGHEFSNAVNLPIGRVLQMCRQRPGGWPPGEACWYVQVNSDAPTITDASTGVSVKPVASSQVVSDGSDGSQASSPSSIGGAANTVTASATPAGQLL